MMPLRHCLTLTWGALKRNRLQTVLAIVGMSVGVGALVTSVALGRGAQQAINEQLRAAGANVIVVTAGNYLQGGGNVGTHAKGEIMGTPTGPKSGDEGTSHNGELLPPQLHLDRPATESYDGALNTVYREKPRLRRRTGAAWADGFMKVHEEDDP